MDNLYADVPPAPIYTPLQAREFAHDPEVLAAMTVDGLADLNSVLTAHIADLQDEEDVQPFQVERWQDVLDLIVTAQASAAP